MHRFLISVILFSSSYVLAQDSKRLYQTKKIATNKTIVLDSLSINPSYFKITDSNGVSVDTDSYFIDFKKAVLNFKNMLPQTDSIEEFSVTFQYDLWRVEGNTGVPTT